MRDVYLICAVLAAGPAAAQEIDFAPTATEACLAGGGGEACIGTSAQICMSTPDGYTTVGMGFCFGSEAEYWDGRLNEAYGRLVAAEEASEAEMADIGASVPPLVEPLRAMQRAWIAFRDASCDYIRAQWGGGTGQGPAAAECLMRETARQALRLEARLGDAEAQQ